MKFNNIFKNEPIPFFFFSFLSFSPFLLFLFYLFYMETGVNNTSNKTDVYIQDDLLEPQSEKEQPLTSRRELWAYYLYYNGVRAAYNKRQTIDDFF